MGGVGNEYILVLASKEKIYKFLGGVMGKGPCLMPNSSLPYSRGKLGCACEYEYPPPSAGNGNSSVVSTSSPSTSLKTSMSISELLGRMLENQDESVEQKRRSASSLQCGELSSTTGTFVFIFVMCLVGVLLVAALVWASWTYSQALLASNTQIGTTVMNRRNQGSYSASSSSDEEELQQQIPKRRSPLKSSSAATSKKMPSNKQQKQQQQQNGISALFVTTNK
jgi:hypothetical protein